ncbi:DUF2231 domain-containing protein [Ideonella sp. BN130291]|uniref:DUF2231 domain-containing protein n=1 Tax=Ideonella sp. BN130291 TaxID=3112940 RepID=UPI002E25B219|nr:DUF2231 domain-containing protein [Ideonella sp. BN130291]
MQSKAKLFGHPVHQMLIVFPLGLLATAVVFDLIHIATDRPLMAVVSYWMMAAGVVGGLVAAPFGWIDWGAIPKGTRAKSVGLTHGLGNVVVLLLFIGSWFLRRPAPEAPGMLAHSLAFLGAGLSLFTAWLGGELVDRLGVGVYDDAGLDAPNSLRARHEAPAARTATH